EQYAFEPLLSVAHGRNHIETPRIERGDHARPLRIDERRLDTDRLEHLRGEVDIEADNLAGIVAIGEWHVGGLAADLHLARLLEGIEGLSRARAAARGHHEPGTQ